MRRYNGADSIRGVKMVIRNSPGELRNSKKHDKIFAIMGMPRSGTTYLAAVLHNPPSVVTISEARGQWKDLMRSDGRSTRVFDIFYDYRERILRGEKIHTFEGTPGYEGKERIDTWNQKQVSREIEVSSDFVLGMKNPIVFLELLPIFKEASTKCVITVRHPLYIINSWVKKVQKRLFSGRTIEGTFANGQCITYDSPSEDPVQRRIDLHNYFAELITNHLTDPNVMLIRYEDWFTDKAQLERVSRFLGVPTLGHLRPTPILPDPLMISEEEQRRILTGCLIACEFGYPAEGKSLTPIIFPATGSS